MYRGNVAEFISRLEPYMLSKYGCRIYMNEYLTYYSETKEWKSEKGAFNLCIFAPGKSSCTGCKIIDQVDLEDQVYEAVNRKLLEYGLIKK